MKRLFILLCFAFPFIASAQLRLIAEGETFTEPEEGYARIMALKDGGNAFLHVTNKEGIEMRIYDASHTMVLNKTIHPDYGKLKAAEIEGIYEIGDEIIIFISEQEDKMPTLYRLRIDEHTGGIIELKTIGTLMRLSMGQGYAMAFGHVPKPGFMVRNDAATGNLSVVLFNAFESDRGKRVELVQYDASGAEIGRAYLSSPDAKYKFTNILDCAVVANTSYVLLYSYNTENSGGAASELLLATVNDGKVRYSSIGDSYKRRIDEGLLKYNPVTQNLIFLTSELQRREGMNAYYALQFAIIDPANPEVKQTIDYGSGSITATYRRVFKNGNRYGPMPQSLYINDDGSFTVLMEEITQIYRASRMGVVTPSGAELGTAALVTYSEDGQEIAAALIPKLQTFLPGMMSSNYRTIGAFYIAERENGATILSGGNQYKSLVYLNGKKSNYVLLNDVEENTERIKKGKLTNIKGVGDCDAWYYDLNKKNGDLPERNLMFAKDRPKDNNLAILNISSYDRARDIYTTLKLEKGKVKMAWFTGS